MNPLSIVCLAACLVAVACASSSQRSSNSIKNNLRPSEWLSVAELESLPALNEITLQRLESLSVDKGAELIDAVYHLSQLSRDVKPNYVPNPSQIPAYIVKSNGEKVTFNLDQLPNIVKPIRNIADEEVTVIITGLPNSLPAVQKANQRLVNAYRARYNLQPQQQSRRLASSDEIDTVVRASTNVNSGGLLVIELGEVLNSVERLATVNIQKTGNAIGNILVEAIENAEVPQELINIVAQGVSAHIAGAAARQYTRRTGNQLRRITALDPSKIFARNANTLTALSRGAAEFVDAIHTSAYGLGTVARVGNIDFYPEGPSEGVPGADNVIEAAMRATRYFAESVRPGNERNFPAVAAVSLQQYRNNNGNGRRVYMGVATEFDEQGDYILEVNSSSPFGKSAPARKQNGYHGRHVIPQNADY